MEAEPCDSVGENDEKIEKCCNNSLDSGIKNCDSPAEPNYKLLSYDEVNERMQKIITDAAEVLALTHHQVQLLLQQFKWDVDGLMEKYYDCESGVALLQKLHIPIQTEDEQSQEHADSDKQEQLQNRLQECNICYEEFARSNLNGVGCGHRYCNSCWNSYLTEKMKCHGQFSEIRCPAYKCKTLLQDQWIKSNVTDPVLLRNYNKANVESFVCNKKQLKFCPGRECDLIAEHLLDEPEGNDSRVVCRCGKSFCFRCGNDWHQPISCDMLEAWLKRNNDESMNSHWILTQTKECPKCNTTIEKNGGCNHMTCKKKECAYEFCWSCMGEWKQHGNEYYKCSQFNEERAEKLRKKQSASREFLARYVHYFDLYMNHYKSLEFESKLVKIVEKKMEQIQQVGHSWVETKFLSDAVEALCNCRRVLMYTYVFAYYLIPSNQRHIFEANQQSLQFSIEILSEKLERELDLSELQQMRKDVQDKFRFCLSRAAALVNHVMDGYRNNWWSFDFNQPIRLKRDDELD